MSIYNRWGDEIEIVAHLGVHTIQEFPHPQELLLVRIKPDNLMATYWLFTLRADDGLKEIATAIQNIPIWDLSSRLLQGAILAAQ